MINLDRLSNYHEFSNKIREIEKVLESRKESSNILDKITEFILNNEALFDHEKQAGILLDSLGEKVRHLAPKHPLISKLQNHIQQLLPSDKQNAKISLQFIRTIIQDPSDRLQAIAEWIDLMKIPLAHLDLNEEEFFDLLTQLEYLNFSNYDLQSIDKEKLIKKLFKPNLKFKNTDIISLTTLAKLCAQQSGKVMAEKIQNFGIKDEGALIEIAKLCAQQDGEATAWNIQNFGIK